MPVSEARYAHCDGFTEGVRFKEKYVNFLIDFYFCFLYEVSMRRTWLTFSRFITKNNHGFSPKVVLRMRICVRRCCILVDALSFVYYLCCLVLF